MPTLAAVTAVRAWLNGRTDLVGKGKPLGLGVFRASRPPRSPGQGAYVLLSQISGGSELLAEAGIGRARISATVYAGTEDTAEAAAVAYFNAVEALTGEPAAMGDTARCLIAADLSGPLMGPDDGWLVDADFYLTS
jgi:hypothetical protein